MPKLKPHNPADGPPWPDPPLRNDALWHFCGRCGKRMVWKAREGIVFDRTTGDEGKPWVWSCPMWNKHEASKHDRHDRIIIRPFPLTADRLGGDWDG